MSCVWPLCSAQEILLKQMHSAYRYHVQADIYHKIIWCIACHFINDFVYNFINVFLYKDSFLGFILNIFPPT